MPVHAGKGRIVFTSGPKAAAGFPHTAYSLHGIGWKTSGPQIIFWGSGNQGSLAKAGATQFPVFGEFQILNDAWTDPQDPGLGTQELPGICKDTANPLCAYDTKNEQTPKQG